MTRKKEHEPSYKVWIEFKGKPVLGRGGVQILEKIDEEKSISKAAVELSMSYRYVWNYLDRMSTALGERVVITHKGGRSGGGGATLSSAGKNLVREYKNIDAYLRKILSEKKGTALARPNEKMARQQNS